MRILHLDSGREMRGGQWQVFRLHAGLLDRGVDSMLLAPEHSPLLRLAEARQMPCDVLRPLRIPLLSRRYDLVHAHDARTHTAGVMFSRVPLVVARRVAFPVRTGVASIWKYSKPDLFIAVSQYVGNELRRAGVPDSRISVVHDGVPVPSTSAKGCTVLIPHTTDSAKGMELACRAAELAEVPVHVTRDLDADLPKARALVYLTRSEGLGSGILLAMSHGVTVIASKTGGVPELIEDGETGILVENRVESVAGAFRRINPALGAAARKAVQARFTEARMVQSTMACYQRVLA